MEKIRPWRGQPSDRGLLRTEQNTQLKVKIIGVGKYLLGTAIEPLKAVPLLNLWLAC